MTSKIQETIPTKNAVLFTQRVKLATAEQHTLLESNDLLAALMKDDVTITQYYFYLLLMKKINDTFDRFIVNHVTAALPGLNPRNSSAMIEQDLQAINYTMPADLSIDNYALPKHDVNAPYSLGFMYVMEGSRLGGKVIYKHIQRLLGFNEESGASYIADAGFNTGMLWKEFTTSFSEYITNNNSEEEAISGARDAFSSIYNYFESNRRLYVI